MKEYLGKNSKVYGQTRGKRFILIPAIKRNLPKLSKGKLLDVGCGIGDLSLVANAKGYDYYGVDLSKDMILRAKQTFPRGKYAVAPAADLSSYVKEKFDVVLLNMLLPSVKKQKDVIKIFKECKKVLKPYGKIIIGEPYPTFDGYMQSFLFQRKDVKTKFKGYFASGAPTFITHKMENGHTTFSDYHKTFSDYVMAMKKAGLALEDVDECVPGKEALKFDGSFYEERLRFPTYLLLTCKKDS